MKKGSFLRVSKKQSLSQISSKKKKAFNSLSYFLQSSILGVNFFWEKGSILVGISKKVLFLSQIRKEGSILWVILKKKLKFLSHNQKKKKFNSLSHISVSHTEKKSASHNSKKRFNSLNQTKSSILWVILKNHFFESFFKKKKFNSLRHNSKRKFNSLSHFWKEGSILWFCQNLREKDQSLRHIQEKRFILRVIFRKKGSILWVMKKRKVQFLWLMLERRVQFRESHEKMVQFCESCFFFEKVQLFESFVKRSFNSLSFVSHVQKKKNHFFDSCWKSGFDSLTHIEKEGSVLWVTLSKVQSFDSYFQKVQFLKVIFWRGSSLWVILKKKKKVQFSESIYKRVQFIESYFPKTINLFFESYIVSKRNILWVKLKKRHFLWVMLKRSVQFLIQLCESYWKRFKKIEILEWIIFVKRD